MTIYSDPGCPFSHQTRIVVHEKAIEANLVDLVAGEWPEEVAAVNPYGLGPTLIDRDLALFDSRVINEYLDERFPHPSLMPIDPVERAKIRLMLHRIAHDWYALWPALSGQVRTGQARARKTLLEDLTVLSPLFASSRYFLSVDFTLLDCYVAPLLWRLPALNITLPAKASAVERYARRIFERPGFQASLSQLESGMRPL